MKILSGFQKPTEMDMVQENIKKIEAELQQKIFQLGQTYYEEHKDGHDVDERYYELIDMINKMESNRKGFYKNKMRLEGKMMCENCGSVIPYGSMYCTVCGKKADEKQEGAESEAPVSEAMICKQCGAQLEAGSMFCTVCGTKAE